MPDEIEETETVKGLVIKIPVWKLFRPQFAKMWSVGLGITIQLLMVGKQILDHAVLHMTHLPKQKSGNSTPCFGEEGAEPKRKGDDRTGFEKAIEEGVNNVDWEAVGESLKTEVDKVDWEDVAKGLEEFA